MIMHSITHGLEHDLSCELLSNTSFDDYKNLIVMLRTIVHYIIVLSTHTSSLKCKFHHHHMIYGASDIMTYKCKVFMYLTYHHDKHILRTTYTTVIFIQ